MSARPGLYGGQPVMVVPTVINKAPGSPLVLNRPLVRASRVWVASFLTRGTFPLRHATICLSTKPLEHDVSSDSLRRQSSNRRGRFRVRADVLWSRSRPARPVRAHPYPARQCPNLLLAVLLSRDHRCEPGRSIPLACRAAIRVSSPGLLMFAHRLYWSTSGSSA